MKDPHKDEDIHLAGCLTFDNILGDRPGGSRRNGPTPAWSRGADPEHPAVHEDTRIEAHGGAIVMHAQRNFFLGPELENLR